jgi:gamma-glutamyl-gamma-aminobutyrate hydrolase PuuD
MEDRGNVEGNAEARAVPMSAKSLTGHIAVVGQLRQDGKRIPASYAHAVQLAGGHPKVFSTFDLVPEEPIPPGLEVQAELDPYDESPLEGAVGLLVPGGGDIDPEWYGKPRHPRTNNVSHRRDRFEMTLLSEALERDLPILAICHGMQLLNVFLGGTLIQHLADDPRMLQHDRDVPRAEPAHELRVKVQSRFAQMTGLGNRTAVNSHHHQGLGAVPHVLEQVAWAEDGCLEAVVSREHSWVVGVQWHPEAMVDTDHHQRNLFEAFVKATRDRAGTERPQRAQTA